MREANNCALLDEVGVLATSEVDDELRNNLPKAPKKEPDEDDEMEVWGFSGARRGLRALP